MTPANYYQAHDEIVASLTDLVAKIRRIEEYAASHGLQLYWRGQKDNTWGLTSSLVRQLAVPGVPDDLMLNRVEDRLLADAEAWVADLQAPPLDEALSRLAYMQHHGVPTRLIDFTRDPWVALFFAVEGADAVDGRLFALLIEPSALLSTIPPGTPWRSYRTNEIRMFDPAIAGIKFPRLVVQSAVLAVARLPSTQPHRATFDPVLNKSRSMLAEEVRRIMSIPLKLSGTNPIPPGAASPIGLTLRIHVDKESVRRDLASDRKGRRVCGNKTEISHRTMYPDVAGLAANSALLRGLAKGVLLL